MQHQKADTEISEYISKKKELYDSVLDFIESDDTVDIHQKFDILVKIFEKHQISDNQNELRLLIRMLSQISKNHRRIPGFIEKIEQILLFFENQIKQTLSNFELFDIFKRNYLVLLFLIEKKIITIDQKISDVIVKMKSNINTERKMKLSYFLYPEIKEFLSFQQKEEIEKDIELYKTDFELFNKKRHEGENDSTICYLIRNDLADEFIPYVNQNKIQLSSKLSPSIFETHPLLIKNKPTLIEYAAFFGSIEIVQFLEKNRVDLNPSLWIYVIHSKNPELIHFLENNHVKPPSNSYLRCLMEAIKCHHNDFANYINDNLLVQNNENNNSILNCAFKYYNFDYFEDKKDDKIFFINSCKFDYFKIVEILLKTNEFNPNDDIQPIHKH